MISKELLYEVLFLFLVTIIVFTLGMSNIEAGRVLILIVLTANIQQLIKFRSQDILAIFLFFSILYWVYLLAYYFFGIQYHIYTEYQTPQNTNMVVYLQFLFQRILLIGISPKNYKVPRLGLNIKSNSAIFYALIILLIIVAIAAVYGKQIIIGTNIDYSIDTDSSIWFEYSIPVIIVSYLFADTKEKKIILLFMGLVFMIEPLLFGRRLPFIMVALTLFNLFYAGKVKPIYIFIAIFSAFITLRFLGATRVSSGADATILSSLLSLSDEGIMQNNQGGVIVCAATYYGLIQNGTFDLIFSLKSFLGQFTSVFIPSSLNIKEAYVNFETLKYANIPGNGGLSSIYLYLWGGYTGVFIGAGLLNYVIRNKKYSRILAIYGIFVLSTFPRWYSYNMMILIKMGLWLIILVAITDFFHKNIKR